MSRTGGPVCPGCGYDLSGFYTATAVAWPLEVVCSECGVRISSLELWRRRRIERWSFVHAPRGSLRTWILTSMATLRPWSFWMAMVRAPTRHPYRPLWFGVSWIFAILLLLYLGAGAATVLTWYWSTAITGPWHEAALLALFPFPALVERPHLLAIFLLLPVLVGALPQVLIVAGMLLPCALRRDRARSAGVFVASWLALPACALEMALTLCAVMAVIVAPPPIGPSIVFLVLVGVAMVYPIWLWTWWCAVGTYVRISPGYALLVTIVAVTLTVVAVRQFLNS